VPSVSGIVGVILLVAMVLVLFVIVRFAWSFFRGDVPMEAGGSMGDQFFGRRDRAERPEDWLKN